MILIALNHLENVTNENSDVLLPGFGKVNGVKPDTQDEVMDEEGLYLMFILLNLSFAFWFLKMKHVLKPRLDSK